MNGMNGIMGALEPGNPSYKPREIFVVGESLALTQDLANSIASTARIGCAHGPYPEQRGTSGNFAMGVGGKLTLERGPCTEFCIYHLIPVLEGEEGARRLDRKSDPATRFEQHMPGMPLFSWRITRIREGDYGHLSTNPNGYKPPQTGARKQPHASVIPPPTLNLTQPRTLCDITPVVRSKNSGPYDITFDVVFSHPAIYNLVKSSDILMSAMTQSCIVCLRRRLCTVVSTIFQWLLRRQFRGRGATRWCQVEGLWKRMYTVASNMLGC